MKISKAQRQKNIESVFRAVVRLSADHGFESLTMKAIAKEAGIGEATIYNYFPKKETLVTGFLDWSVECAIAQTGKEPLDEMSFAETVQTLIESHLQIISPSKPFVRDSMQLLFVNPLALSQTSVAQTRDRYVEFVSARFENSLLRGEFPVPPFKDFMLGLLWDFHIGILYYWLKDDHPSYMKTTELVDLSMKLIEELLRSDLSNRLYGIAHFLFKEHVLNQLLTKAP